VGRRHGATREEESDRFLDGLEGGDGGSDDQEPDSSAASAGSAAQSCPPTPPTRWGDLLRIPTVWLLLLQGVPGCIPWGVISAFLPDFLHAEHGLPVQQATLVMTAFSAGGMGGTLVGGEAGQRLYNASARLPPLLMLAAGSLGVLPMWALIASRGEWGFWPSAACAAAGGFLATQTGPNVRSTMVNVTRSEQRGVAFAAFTLSDDVGKGAGPFLIATLVAQRGRERAFSLAMLFWLPCAALCAATALTVEEDQARARSAQKRAGRGHARPTIHLARA